MFCVLLGLVAARASFLDGLIPARLVSVTAIKVGDVACDPALKSFWKFTYHLTHAVPVNVIKGRSQDFVTSVEQDFSLWSTLMFVYCCFDG